MLGRRALMAGAIAALPMAASAADMEFRGKALPQAYDWTITIGLEGKVEPIFQGSKDVTVRPNPLVDIRRYGTPERFRGPRDGIGIGLIEGSNYQIGPVGQFRIARRESDDRAALHGLGNVPWAAELGAFAEYWFVPWVRGRAEVRQGVTGHHGLVADLMLDAVVPVSSQLTLSGGPRVTLASAAATSPYFSIDAVQSAASGRRSMRPEAASGRSEPVRRRAISGRRSGRPTSSSSTNGSPTTPPIRRSSPSAAPPTS